jgi:hypothetical protein
MANVLYRYWAYVSSRLGDALDYKHANLVVQVLLFVAATGALLVALRGTQESIKANEQTRNHFRQDERPYIWPTNNGLGSPVFVATKDGQVIWTWNYTNYGKSPAYKVRFHQYIKIGDRPVVRSYGAKGPSIGPPLPPNKEDFSTVVSVPGISRADFDKLLNQDGSMGIRVHIHYTDAYGGEYETEICLDRLASGAISYCKEGNDIK